MSKARELLDRLNEKKTPDSLAVAVFSGPKAKEYMMGLDV